MSPLRRRRTPSLTLVASSGAASAADAGGVGDERNTPRPRDWSGLMVRAQDGDRRAYRALLEDMAPYLRALALAAMLRYAALLRRGRRDGRSRGRGHHGDRAVAGPRSRCERHDPGVESRHGGADHGRRQPVRPPNIPLAMRSSHAATLGLALVLRTQLPAYRNLAVNTFH